MIQDRDQEIEGKLFDRELSMRLLRYARPYRAAFLGSLVMLLMTAVAVNGLPFIIKVMVDKYLAPSDTSLTLEYRVHGLAMLTLLFLGVAFMGYSFRYAQSYVMAWLGEHIIYDIRADVFAKIQRLHMQFFDRTRVGRLMTRVTSDVEAMQRMVSDGIIGLAADLFTLFVIIGYMLYLSVPLSVILFMILPVIFFSIRHVNTNLRESQRRVRRQQSALNAYVQEMITGMLTVQLFNREHYAREQYDKRNGKLVESWFSTIHWFSLFWPMMEILNAVSFGLVLCAGGACIITGVGGLQIGVLVAFLLYIRDFFRPLEDLSDKTYIFQSAMASCERIFALLDTPEEISDPEDPVEIGKFKGEVEFRNVSFAYSEGDLVLKNISLHIEHGEAAAFVGATGAGKSSIISLIGRFYEVSSGGIHVDGVDVRNYRQADLRKRIGIVLQDPFIFADTIANNISMHNPAVSRDDIEKAAAYVNADRFIRELPSGYDTHVQERGITLSTGQKQLLALARALVQNPDILLILDEATANVDTETEQLIQDALEKLMKGRTSIIIAHRLSTIRHVDKIFVMRHGNIVEEGSHVELLKQGGYYRKLYELLSHSR